MTVYRIPSSLALTDFVIRPYFAGHTAVQSPFSGVIRAENRSPFLWAGTCQWDIRNRSELKELSRIAALLRGQANQLLIPLPNEYRVGRLVQPGLSVSIGAQMRINPDGTLECWLNATEDGWRPERGDWLTMDSHLYQVSRYLGETIHEEFNIYLYRTELLPPRVIEELRRTGRVEYLNPFVVVVPASPDQFNESIAGWRTGKVLLEWVEAYQADTTVRS